jgi:hypothetical protein
MTQRQTVMLAIKLIATAISIKQGPNTMTTQVYEMHIERHGKVKPHGFHLGTDIKIAESFVFEQLEAGADSIALRLGGKLVKIYDYRDLPTNQDEAND